MTLVVSICGASGAGKSQLTKAVVTTLGEDLCARVPADYFIVPANQPLAAYVRQPLAYDWDQLRQVLALSVGTIAQTPAFDFTRFQRMPGAEQRSFPVRPVMIIDAIYPYPTANLTILVEAPAAVRSARISERDTRWNTTVADRWTQLELSRQQLDRSSIAYDLRLSGTQPLMANAAAITAMVRQRLH